MPWPVSSDPLDFEEAIAWFRKRLSIGKFEFERLRAEAKRKAFTVANVAHLDVIDQVWKAIDRALAKGTPLEQFKKEIGDELRAAWSGSVDNPPWRLETIFRTNVQLAYSAGRHKQASDPDVVAARPLWMFDAILDGRETPICKECDGTVRPADDDWWSTHQPPLHFNCRSSFITLTEKEGKRRGITLVPPKAKAQDGFGLEPGSDEWGPQKAKYPQQLWLPFMQKQQAAPPKPPPLAKGLEAGRHIKALSSQLSKKQTDELLASVKDPNLLAWLEKNPLRRLGFPRTARAGRTPVNGFYDINLEEIEVTGTRTSKTFGKPFIPGTSWSLSMSAKNAADARARTLLHEIGHHVHLRGKDTKVDRIIAAAFRATKSPITKYGSTCKEEYFSESFTAYFYERAKLKAHDPTGFKMVEDVFRARGMLP